MYLKSFQRRSYLLSWTTVAPVKYEHDIQFLTTDFANVEKFEK